MVGGSRSHVVVQRAWDLMFAGLAFGSCPTLAGRATLGKLLPVSSTVLPDP